MVSPEQTRMPERAKYELSRAIGRWLESVAASPGGRVMLAPSTEGTTKPAHALSDWQSVMVSEISPLVWMVKIYPKGRAPRYLNVIVKEMV